MHQIDNTESEDVMKRARWWMRRRWFPRTFAEYMATPSKCGDADFDVVWDAQLDAAVARHPAGKKIGKE